MHRRLGISIAFAISLATPSRADATVVKAMTLEEKTQTSPLVVHASVERVEVEWEIPDARARTMITVRVLEVLKGDARPGEKLIVRQTGGKIGDFHQTASGLSKWEEGEECVLFLEPLGPWLIEIGIGIGKYAIEQRGGEKTVTFSPNVVAFRSVLGQRGRVEQMPPFQPTPLPAFLKEVRSYARNIPIQKIIVPKEGLRRKPAELERPIRGGER
jgi:hypothetical protein